MAMCTACGWYTHLHRPGCAEVPDGRVTYDRVLAAIPIPPRPRRQ